MRYDITLQYLPPGAARPNEETHKELMQHGDNDFTPIPAVSDRVAYDGTDALVTRKVVSRHFSYFGNRCHVNIVVTDIPDDEMAARLKM